MEKKEYIKPEMEEVTLNTVQIIAASIEIGEEGEYADGSDALATGRRGKWGNLWYKED